MRKILLGLLALALAGILAAPARADDAFTPAQKQELDQAIHDYLQNHPEAMMQALETMKKKEEAALAEKQSKAIVAHREQLLSDPNSAIAGNPKGDVTIVEFFDYRCPYCKQIEPSMDALLKEDGKLRIVYKEFPILGPVSVFASRAAIASRKQGKYEMFHRQMMAAKGNIDNDAVLKVAASSGLDMAKLKTDMAAADVDQVIKANYTLAETLAIDGTPGLIIGDQLTEGAVDLDGLRAMIKAARKGS
jgi:protein-disulfide isomerase